MPPCLDVYIWIPRPTAECFDRFVDRFVDAGNPPDDRLAAFRRVYVQHGGTDEDRRLLTELSADGEGGPVTLYLRARGYHEAIIASTDEDAAVFGLGLDDPDNAPETLEVAGELLRTLRNEFAAPAFGAPALAAPALAAPALAAPALAAPAGVAGVELPPPHTRAEWLEDDRVQLRVGEPAG